METYIAGMPAKFLRETLAEAETDPDSTDYEIPVTLPIDTEAYIALMQAELLYRQQVDAEREQKRQQNLLVN